MTTGNAEIFGHHGLIYHQAKSNFPDRMMIYTCALEKGGGPPHQ